MCETADLLTPAHNYAVVQLPGRQYPGVVFQGDSLHILLATLKEIRSELVSKGVADVGKDLDDVCQDLSEVLFSYKKVCKERNIALPFKENP